MAVGRYPSARGAYCGSCCCTRGCYVVQWVAVRVFEVEVGAAAIAAASSC
jgi:hypothetical protein